MNDYTTLNVFTLIGTLVLLFGLCWMLVSTFLSLLEDYLKTWGISLPWYLSMAQVSRIMNNRKVLRVKIQEERSKGIDHEICKWSNDLCDKIVELLHGDVEAWNVSDNDRTLLYKFPKYKSGEKPTINIFFHLKAGDWWWENDDLIEMREPKIVFHILQQKRIWEASREFIKRYNNHWNWQSRNETEEKASNFKRELDKVL